MCRFALYLGEEITLASLVTEPTYSILHQSFHSHERVEPLNGDGFGVAWYPKGVPEPGLLKELRPAWNSRNLRSLARVTRSRCLLAHVRAATSGLAVTQLNCHPFAWRHLSFMHNGTVGGFRRLKHRLVTELAERTFLEIEGSTDSEHVFALVKEAWCAAVSLEPLERLVEALRRAVERIEALRRAVGSDEPSLLNLVLCDGERAVISRYVSEAATVAANSLYVHSGRRYICEDGACRMLEPGSGSGAVIVASEPLSEDPGWEKVPVNSIVSVDRSLRVGIDPW